MAAANSSRDTIWFVCIANNNKLAQENVSDDYGNVSGLVNHLLKEVTWKKSTLQKME